MANPFTIRIFAPEGNPEGIRIIDKLTSTGIFFVFPRDKWPDIRNRKELMGAGVYILRGYAPPNDDLPTIYIGQGDVIKDRINSHYKEKDFWDLAVIFTSPSRLNSAHTKWLEHALVRRANKTGRSILDNSNEPSEPNISEAEHAELRVFLDEICQTLPLVDIKAFEESKPRLVNQNKKLSTSSGRDTIIVPARDEGFKNVFIEQNGWWAIRISGGMLDKLRYIAAYRVAPKSAITHWAEIKQIEPYGNEGKYKLVFKGSAQELKKPIGIQTRRNALQGPKYTNFQRLMQAKDVSEL